MRLHLPTSYAYIGGVRWFVDQIPRMGVILMGYCMEVQLMTMSSGVMCKNKFRMGDMTPSRIFMVPCEMFGRTRFSSISSIDLFGGIRGIVDGCGGEILLFW